MVGGTEIFAAESYSHHTLSEEIAHPTIYQHLSQLSVDIQLNGLIKCREDSTHLEQVLSCSSVSCLINMEPVELLRLQPSEPIASESVWNSMGIYCISNCKSAYV